MVIVKCPHPLSTYLFIYDNKTTPFILSISISISPMLIVHVHFFFWKAKIEIKN